MSAVRQRPRERQHVRAVETFGESQACHDAFEQITTRLGRFVLADERPPAWRGHQVVIQAGNVFPSQPVNMAAGGWARSEPVFLSPIREVVAALRAWLGEVADFVPLQGLSGEERCCRIEHVCFEIIVGGGELAALEAGGHGGARLVGEAVAGKVFGAERDCGVEVGHPVAHGLAWYAEDKIDGVALDAGCTGVFHGTGDAHRVVPAFEGLEVCGVEGLGAHADAVDAAADERVGEFLGDGLGVALDGELAAPVGNGTCVEQLVEVFKKAFPEWHDEKARSAAADEDGVDGASGPMTQGLEFGDQAVDERGLAVAVVNDAVEVAVVAFVEAKWDMDVEGCGGVPRGVRERGFKACAVGSGNREGKDGRGRRRRRLRVGIWRCGWGQGHWCMVPSAVYFQWLIRIGGAIVSAVALYLVTLKSRREIGGLKGQLHECFADSCAI